MFNCFSSLFLLLLLSSSSSSSQLFDVTSAIDESVIKLSRFLDILVEDVFAAQPEFFKNPFFYPYILIFEISADFLQIYNQTSDARKMMRLRANQTEQLFRLVESDLPVLLPLLFRAKKVTPDMKSFSDSREILQFLCDDPNFWPEKENSTSDYNSTIVDAVFTRLSRSRQRFCLFRDSNMESEVKSFRRNLFFRINKRVYAMDHSLDTFIQVVRDSLFALQRLLNHFIVRFFEHEESSRDLLDRLSDEQLHFGLLPVVIDVLGVDDFDPKTDVVSEAVAFARPFVLDVANSSKLELIFDQIDIVTSCPSFFERLDYWPILMKHLIFDETPSSCDEASRNETDMVVNFIELALYVVNASDEQALKYLDAILIPADPSQPSFSRIWTFQPLLYDDFSFYEFVLFLFQPKYYMKLIQDRDSWKSLVCSEPKIKTEFVSMTKMNVSFLSSYLCEELHRNPDRVSVMMAALELEPIYDPETGDSEYFIATLRDRLVEQAELVVGGNISWTARLSDCLQLVSRRMEALFGPSHFFVAGIDSAIRLAGVDPNSTASLPPAPRDLKIAAVDDAAFVKWTPPFADLWLLTDYHFKVEWFPSSKPPIIVKNNITTALISNLTPGQQYTVCVCTEYKDDGRRSLRECVPIQIRPFPPRNLTVSVLTNILLLSWSPPNGRFESYLVVVNVTSAKSSISLKTVSLTMSTRSYLLGFAEGDSFQFDVYAILSKGSFRSSPARISFNETKKIEASFLITGHPLVADFWFSPSPRRELLWRVDTSVKDVDDLIGFVVHRQPGISSPLVIDFDSDRNNYSLLIDVNDCDVEYFLAPMTRDLYGRSSLKEEWSLLVPCPTDPPTITADPTFASVHSNFTVSLNFTVRLYLSFPLDLHSLDGTLRRNHSFYLSLKRDLSHVFAFSSFTPSVFIETISNGSVVIDGILSLDVEAPVNSARVREILDFLIEAVGRLEYVFPESNLSSFWLRHHSETMELTSTHRIRAFCFLNAVVFRTCRPIASCLMPQQENWICQCMSVPPCVAVPSPSLPTSEDRDSFFLALFVSAGVVFSLIVVIAVVACFEGHRKRRLNKVALALIRGQARPQRAARSSSSSVPSSSPSSPPRRSRNASSSATDVLHSDLHALEVSSSGFVPVAFTTPPIDCPLRSPKGEVPVPSPRRHLSTFLAPVRTTLVPPTPPPRHLDSSFQPVLYDGGFNWDARKGRYIVHPEADRESPKGILNLGYSMDGDGNDVSVFTWRTNWDSDDAEDPNKTLEPWVERAPASIIRASSPTPTYDTVAGAIDLRHNSPSPTYDSLPLEVLPRSPVLDDAVEDCPATTSPATLSHQKSPSSSKSTLSPTRLPESWREVPISDFKRENEPVELEELSGRNHGSRLPESWREVVGFK